MKTTEHVIYHVTAENPLHALQIVTNAYKKARVFLHYDNEVKLFDTEKCACYALTRGFETVGYISQENHGNICTISVISLDKLSD